MNLYRDANHLNLKKMNQAATCEDLLTIPCGTLWNIVEHCGTRSPPCGLKPELVFKELIVDQAQLLNVLFPLHFSDISVIRLILQI